MVSKNITGVSFNNGRCATARIFEFVGNLHDLESYQSIGNNLDLTVYIFASHWGHLSVIFIWISGTLFHIGWTGNFSAWTLNPASTIAISHPIWDLHFSGVASNAALASSPSYSGISNWLLAVGYRTESQLYSLVLGSQILALLSILLGKIHISYSTASHYWSVTKRPVLTHNRVDISDSWETFIPIPLRYYSTYLESTGIRLNFHLGALLGSFSALWSCHLVHVSIPASRGLSIYDNPFSNMRLIQNITYGTLANFMSCPDEPNHVFGSSVGSGSSLLTFIGGINTSTGSLYMSDIAHHHLSIGVIFIWAAHLYSSFTRAIGQSAPDILAASGLKLVTKYIVKSLNLQLALALTCISIATSTVGHQMYSMPSYPYISYDYVTTLALYIHHNWISSLLMIGAFAHSSLFLIRDYTNPGSRSEDLISRLLFHKASLISHLSWCTLFLGFHTLGLYVHNDVVCAFGEPYKQLLIEPYLAQFFMNSLAFTTKSYGYLGHYLIDSSFIKPSASSDLLSSCLGPGDFISYHAVALGLHVTSLILLKGSLDSQGSSLMPDKVQFGYGFACDGPARGGTCDISSWDAFYLALFWVLNSNCWLMFYFHWKHLLFWQSLLIKFEENSTFLNGWFRDYLWFNSSALIRGYDSTGSNDLSVWSWSFLAAHLCWAVGFMFLISWRGYWQEIIESIIYMHLKTPLVYDLWNGSSYSPVALSIVQARFIGVFHFASGLILTYAAFVLGASS